MRLFLLFTLFVTLAACSDSPDELANAELVRINKELTLAATMDDLDERLAAINSLHDRFLQVVDKFPTANSSIQILSGIEIAGLSTEKFNGLLRQTRDEIGTRFFLTVFAPMSYFDANGRPGENPLAAVSKLDLATREAFALCVLEEPSVRDLVGIRNNLPWIEEVLQNGFARALLNFDKEELSRLAKEHPQLWSKIAGSKSGIRELRPYVDPNSFLRPHCVDLIETNHSQ